VTAPDGGPDRKPGPDRVQARLLTELGGQVRDINTKLAKLRLSLGEVAGVVSEFGPELADVQKGLAEVRGQVASLLEETPEVTNPPVDWTHLPAEQAEREWDVLGRWVHEVLAGEYEITREQLPDCWALHRPALRTLTWLRCTYVDAYAEGARNVLSAEWNTRWMDSALAKIKDAIPASRCRPRVGEPGEHLVDVLAAQQQRSRVDPDQLRQNAQALRQQTSQPAYSAPGQPTGPYPAPSGPYPAPPATPAAGQPAPVATGSDSPGQQIIRLEFWRPFFDQAMRADIERRRAAEQAATEADNAAHRDSGEQPPSSP
jgi:hypothetical protein